MGIYNRYGAGRTVNMRNFLQYENIKDGIFYRLANTQRDKELLEDIPHKEFLDLSVIFLCTVTDDRNRKETILVYNAHLKLWDVSVDELYSAAQAATPALYPYEIKSMDEVMCEIMQEENPDAFDHEACMKELEGCAPVYVLSNIDRAGGASCVLYPGAVSGFADTLDSDLYIIFPSIHECLLLPAGEFKDTGELKNMIKEVNETMVKEEEALSDSLYLYSREDGRITLL